MRRQGSRSRCAHFLGQRQQAVRAAHGEAVGEQRLDDVAIVAVAGARAIRELADESGAALAARALEAALLAQRREDEAPGRAALAQRAALAARHAREADLSAEIEERLVPVPRAAGRRRDVRRPER